MVKVTLRYAHKTGVAESKIGTAFGHARRPARMFRVGLYARVSTNDQPTLAMQNQSYCCRSASTGSICAAFQAGKTQAMKVMASMNTGTPRNVTGSIAGMP
jgi:hypothetical protein